VGGANIQIAHYHNYFDHGYLEEGKSMIHVHSFTVIFGAKYLTGMV